jgi:hypothetical protein
MGVIVESMLPYMCDPDNECEIVDVEAEKIHTNAAATDKAHASCGHSQ